MADDPKLNAVIDTAVHAKLVELLGFMEGEAEPYIVPLRQAVMAALAKAGYKVSK